MGCILNSIICSCRSPSEEPVDPEMYIQNKYTFGKTLGKGCSCRVVAATEKRTNKRFALKIMSQGGKINEGCFEKERDILQILQHANIISLVEFYVDLNSYYLITQLCEGGELFDRIVDKSYPITEKRACELVRTMLLAIKHCHEKNIVHRDIKPENFVFKTKERYSDMVLIDFGCATIVEDDKEYKDLVGTPFYLAPESAAGKRYVRTGLVLKSSDLWSIGVITYVLMTGRPPFNGHSNPEIFSNIIKKPLRFPDTVRLSESFVNFCQRILKKSPKRRMLLAEAIDHPWVQGKNTSDRMLSEDVLRVLRQFNQQSKLKKAISKTLADNMGEEPKKKIVEHFNRLDKTGSGALSADELSILLMDMGYTQDKALEEAKVMIASTNEDDSGVIKFAEFAAIWQRKLLTVNGAYIHAVFSILDADNNGLIGAKELGQVLDMTGKGDEIKIQEIIKEVDKDRDGKISFEEFKSAMLERDSFRGKRAKVGQNLDVFEVNNAELGSFNIDYNT